MNTTLKAFLECLLLLPLAVALNHIGLIDSPYVFVLGYATYSAVYARIRVRQ